MHKRIKASENGEARLSQKLSAEAESSHAQPHAQAVDACALQQVNLSLHLDYHATENHRKPLYCIKFNHADDEYSNYFATVGANQATVYRIADQGSAEPVQSFVDHDKFEKFYSCEWTSSDEDTPLLIVAGLRGIIKVINCVTFEICALLVGHGNAVNDVKAHPVDNSLILSASKDESVRLWNIQTCVCIAVFAGDKGHRDEIFQRHQRGRGRQRTHRHDGHRQQQLGHEHPAAPAAQQGRHIAIDQGGPEKLDGVGRAYQGEEADFL